MTALSEPPKISTTTTAAPDGRPSSSPVSVAHSIVQKLTEKVTVAYSNIQKTASDAAVEPKKTVMDEAQISQQEPGQIFKLDPSQPIYDDDSHVFVYFMLAMLICALGYIVFHNKRKILALIIEGRQTHGDVRRSGGVNYKRLNTEPPGVSVA